MERTTALGRKARKAASAAPKPSLGAHERRILRAVAEAALPAGRLLPGADDASVARIESLVVSQAHAALAALRVVLWAIEASTVARAGRPFTKLPLDRRIGFLESWYRTESFLGRAALRALLTPIKAAHYDTPEMHALVGARWSVETPLQTERPPWLANVTDGHDVTDDDAIECDVVVVGSGAGGATIAAELAARGHAVVIVESGRYFDRGDFTGRPTAMTHAMYLDRGMTVALGNVGAPIWAGRTVGGSTTINSGTCYRPPPSVLARWRRELGLAALTDDALGPCFDRVEAVLGVEPAQREHVGSIADVIARGADRLGYSHHVLTRNAPGCDGQGLCCFGCPTGAKRSADVSWIPKALERGAMLMSSTRVVSIDGDTASGRAVGVTARTAGGARLKIRARATVVACGTLLTPVLLARSGLVKNRWLGQNLSIHPAGKAMAVMPERQDQWRGIPQSYAIDEFRHEGMMFEGGSLPFSIATVSLPTLGPRFVELVERYPHLATFGFMIADTSRGTVRPRPGSDGPLITYELNRHDAARMHRAMGILAEVFLEAGAEIVMPGVFGFDELHDKRDLERFRSARIAASRFEVTAYHPLGTARMARSSADGVIGPDHESHDVADLYVVDGSAVPSSLGVNPQVTIMALAVRAAELLDRRLTMRGAQ